jgi:hypothetical protein
MNIELTKEQFANILRAVYIANDIIGLISDMVSEDYKKKYAEMDELREYLLKCAWKNGFNEFIDYYKEHIIPSDNLCEEMDKIKEDYEDFIFWDELEYRLALRDLEQKLTEEEKERISKDDFLYMRKLEEFRDKYSEEFQKYGITRLEIKK